MEPVGTMLLGLALFFVGMRFVGDNLKQLSGRSFRSWVSRTTGQGWLGGLLGLVFGALMQSATAVTFILVSMVGSGLIPSVHAFPVIAWANVGLTAFAFVASLNIHPFVIYLVGLSGIVLAFWKRPRVQLTAGVLLGIGLLLLGLQTITEGARPLHHQPWFRELLAYPAESPLLGFAIGILLALIVQSNTAATLMVIALAGAGAISLPSGMMMVYGANLGTIFLRLVLAAGLHGSALQLVRFEDLLCLVGGTVMFLLFYLETLARVPLVAALVTAVSPDPSVQLACAFLLSNLIPALLLSGLQKPVRAALERFWPAGPEESASVPKFLNSQALADPETAIDLILREEARLLRHGGAYLARLRRRDKPEPFDAEKIHHPFATLAQQIADYAADLTRAGLSANSAARLALAQNQLSLVNFVEEGARELAQTASRIPATPATDKLVNRLCDALETAWNTAVEAADSLRAEPIARLRETCSAHGARIEEIKAAFQEIKEGGSRPELLNLASGCELIIWMLHRLARILAEESVHQVSQTA